MEINRRLADLVESDAPATISVWRANHGTLLLCFVGMIVVLGTSVLACRQTKAVSSRFPRNLLYQDNEQAIANFIQEAELGDRRVIQVRILGAVSDRGWMRLAFYTTPESFLNPALALDTDSWRIRGGVCEGHLAIPAELTDLAVVAYHDENENGQLDRNGIGIPSERYGYSNNARDHDGPPTFPAASIKLNGQPIEISIR